MDKPTVVIPIKGTQLRWPRDEEGDPAFRTLTDLHVLFVDEQIVEMCNRYLKYQEYIQLGGTRYALRKREETKRLRKIAHQLFPECNFESLTASQLERVRLASEKKLT